jgi:hypothetical protein
VLEGIKNKKYYQGKLHINSKNKEEGSILTSEGSIQIKGFENLNRGVKFNFTNRFMGILLQLN